MMTLNKAKGLALESLARLTGRPASDLCIIDELTQCRRIGWIFSADHGPVVVTHAGEVHHLAGERLMDTALRELENHPLERVGSLEASRRSSRVHWSSVLGTYQWGERLNT